MRKITLLLMLFVAGWCHAQAHLYSFSASTAPYAETSASATLLPAVKADTSISTAQPIGFNFVYEGTTYTTFMMSSNGFISFAAAPTSLTGNDLSAANATSRPILAPLWDDLDGAGSPTAVAAYEVTGTAPNRVLTVEWRNWEWNYAANAAVISFQVMLHETTNVISFAYRQEATAINGTPTATIGINNATGSGPNSYLNVTNLTTPAVSSSTTANSLNVKPATGTLFTFTPPPACEGTPGASTLSPSEFALCNGGAVGPIVLTMASGASGLTYQWEESTDDFVTSADAVGGTGATTSVYTPPVYNGTPKKYRAKITCTASALFSYSPSATVGNAANPVTAASAITYTGITFTGMTINWTNGSGGRRYVVVNTENQFAEPENNIAPGTAATAYAGGEQVVYDGTGSSVAITGLSCGTTYYVRVYEYLRCGTAPTFEYYYNTTTSATNPNSQVSAAPMMASLPVLNDFTDFTGSNLSTVFPGWSEGAGNVTPTGSTSSWLQSTYMPVPTAKVNLYLASKREWIISPKMAITESTTLSFKAAVTDFGNSGPNESGGIVGTDDTVSIMISEDGCGLNWTAIHTFDANSGLTEILETFEFPLDDYIGSTIQVAFKASEGTVDNTPDYDFHITNIRIRKTPTCLEPTALAVSSITATTAMVTFEAPGVTPSLGYDYVLTSTSVYPGDNATANGTLPAANDFADLSGLTPGTKYFVWIRSKCSASDIGPWSEYASFTTSCQDVTTFMENFDAMTSTGANVLPACWRRMGTALTSYVTTGGVTPGSAPNRFYMFATGATPTEAFAMMPPVSNLQAETHRLKFKAYGTTAGGTLDIGYFTEFTDVSTFVVLETVDLPSTTAASATEFIIMPADIPAGVKSLVFRNGGLPTAGLTLYIDDIVWEPIPACPDVTDLTIWDVETNSATFTWEPGGSESSWNVIWGPSTVTDPNDPTIAANISTVTLPTTTISAFTPQTTYKVWVRTDCGLTDGTWIGPITFTTQCEAAPVPYTLDFESVTVPAIPACTSRLNAGSGNNWATAAPAAYGFTSKVLSYGYNSANAANAWFFTQGLNLVAGQSYDLSFRYGSNSTAYIEKLRVSVGSAPDELMDQEIINLPAISNNVALSATASFTVDTDGVYFIGFNVYSAANQFNLYVDDISVVLTPTCLPVTALTLGSASAEDAEIQWEASETEPTVGYQYAFSTTNTIPATLDATNSGTVAPAENSAVISGLTPNTTYFVWVRTLCSVSDTSAWTSSITFTTQCLASDLPYVQNFESAVTPALPGCTTRLNAGTGNNWVTASQTLYGFSSKVLSYGYNSANAANAWFFTQGLNLMAGQSYDLSFRYGSNSTAYVEKLRVNIGSAPDATMDQEIIDLPSISNNVALPAAASFTVDADGVYYIGFNVYSAANQFNLYVDDIVVELTPTCVKPTAVMTTGLSNNDAEISWTESVTVPTVGYQYAYATTNTIPATLDATNSGTVLPAVNSVTITGLTANTTYYVWVRTVCTVSDSSAWTPVHSFTTQCNDVTSFTENFDSYSTGANVLPTCWSRTGTATTAYVTTGGVAPGSAPNRFYMFATGNGTNPTEVFAILPAVSNLQAETHQLKFKAYATAAGRTLEVGYFENLTDMSSFILIETINLPSTAASTATEFFVIPEGVPAGVKNLVFRNGGIPTGSTTLYIDDVSWETIPTCVAPTALVASDVTSNSVTLEWEPSFSAPANGYQYAFATSNTVPATLTAANSGTVAAGETTAELTGLAPVTTYYVWVRAICSDSDSSAWSLSISFTTPCATIPAPYTQDFATFLPSCWSRASAGDVTTGPSGTGTMVWVVDGFLNAGTTGATKVNIYDTGKIGWLISPNVNLSDDAFTYEVSFNYGVTDYNNTAPSDMGVDDSVSFVMSEDGGATWTEVIVFDADSNVTNTSQTFSAEVTSSSDNVKFAFISTAGTINDTTTSDIDFEFFVDNFAVTSTPLGIGTVDNSTLRLYPNPVKDVLNVEYTQNITDVRVFNILGQQVMTKAVNANVGQIDMTTLAAGTYLVKVYADNEVKTIKVIKQ